MSQISNKSLALKLYVKANYLCIRELSFFLERIFLYWTNILKAENVKVTGYFFLSFFMQKFLDLNMRAKIKVYRQRSLTYHNELKRINNKMADLS